MDRRGGDEQRRIEQGLGVCDAIIGQRGKVSAPFGGEAKRRRAGPLSAIRARIKPVEHRDRQAVVVAMALGDDFAILPYLVDGAVDGAVKHFVGEPRAGHR